MDVEDKYLSLLGFIRDPSGKETTQAQKLGLEAAELSVRNNNGTVPILVVTAVRNIPT